MAITEAKKRNNANYTAKCDYINVRPLKAEGAAIRAAAEASGKSLQKYILEAVRARIKYLSVAAMFSEAIERTYQEVSISKLFR